MLCIWRIRVHVIILWNSCMAIGYFFRWSNSWTSIDGRKNLVTYFCIIFINNTCIRMFKSIHILEILYRNVWLFVIYFRYIVFIQNPPLHSNYRHVYNILGTKVSCVLCLSDIEFSWSQCFSFYGIQARNITLDNWYYSIFYILITKSNAVEEKMIWLYNVVRKCLLGFNQQDDSD